jgi:integrase
VNTPFTQSSDSSPEGLLAKLMAAVRVDFRAEVLEFAPDDAVFGTSTCLIGGCERMAHGQGMCSGHHLRWVNEGRPDPETFVATTDRRWRRQRPNMCCRVEGCRYGAARKHMCALHAQRWERCGRPDLAGWLADPPAVKQPAAGSACLIAHCDLWPQSSSPFCHSHTNTWRVNGRGDPDEFACRFDQPLAPLSDVIRMAGLPAQLRLELAYALQCRADERASKTPPAVVMQVVRFLTTVPERSLLEASEADWRARIGRPAPLDSNRRALLIYARRRVEDLAAADGWDAEYPRDLWRLRRLGFEGNPTLCFAPIASPVFRELAKRWVRHRLATGLNLETVRRGLRSIIRFAGFCERLNVSKPVDVHREVLERYLADLRGEWAGRQRHGDHIAQLDSWFAAIRRHRWDDTLTADAVFFTEDYPKRPQLPPRALSDHVMAQIEAPQALVGLADPAYRLVTLILIRAGLRVNDALRLRPDCVVADAAGAPFLRYFNHKMKREALVPIDEEIRALIGEQRDHASGHWLFPRPTKNPDGRQPVSSSTYRMALYRWLARCEIRDENGHPIHFTPHQWRHTLGTRLINRDVPQEVVRRILDHDSPYMTSHYARLHDDTVRRHWEAARKIDIHGEHVTVDPDGPLAEAAWANQRLGRATQALPNGYCGLPVQKSCPPPNASTWPSAPWTPPGPAANTGPTAGRHP